MARRAGQPGGRGGGRLCQPAAVRGVAAGLPAGPRLAARRAGPDQAQGPQRLLGAGRRGADRPPRAAEASNRVRAQQAQCDLLVKSLVTLDARSPKPRCASNLSARQRPAAAAGAACGDAGAGSACWRSARTWRRWSANWSRPPARSASPRPTAIRASGSPARSVTPPSGPWARPAPAPPGRSGRPCRCRCSMPAGAPGGGRPEQRALPGTGGRDTAQRAALAVQEVEEALVRLDSATAPPEGCRAGCGKLPGLPEGGAHALRDRCRQCFRAGGRAALVARMPRRHCCRCAVNGLPPASPSTRRSAGAGSLTHPPARHDRRATRNAKSAP